jgi:general secretion pathway protein D
MLSLLMAAAFALSLSGEEKPAFLLPCPPGTGEAACNPSQQDLKQAKAAFVHGVKLEKNSPEEAYQEFEHAAQLVPRDIEYITARELARQRLVNTRLERGNAELEAGKQVEALADFRTALQLDPANAYAQQRLRDAAGDRTSAATSGVSVVDQSPEFRLAPDANRASFHFRGDNRELLANIARTYGISAQIEESVTSKHVTFDVDDVDFYQAMVAAEAVTKTFWTPLDTRQILIAPDTPENRRQFERMAMRTFYVPQALTIPTALNDVANLLRNLFDIHSVTPNSSASTLVVHAPQRVLDAATQFLASLDGSRPQVMLDVYVYQVSNTMMRDLGVHLPNQFNIFNIPAGALAALAGQNIQQLVNQLISSGGINQANSQAISALLAQLQGQNQQNSIFSQPLATFGGGKTLTGITLDQLSAQLSLNQGWVKTLDHASLRASQATDATFRMGSRFPVLNASFAPIFNSAAISQVIQNQTFQAAFPSVNYEDLGLTIKAKPAISSHNEVGLQLEIDLRALTGQSLNGVPVIGNREYKGTITVIDGEPAVVAGQVSHTETLAMSGIPGLGQIPGLNKITTTNSKQTEDDELLVVITPHITIRSLGQNSEVYLPR